MRSFSGSALRSCYYYSFFCTVDITQPLIELIHFSALEKGNQMIVFSPFLSQLNGLFGGEGLDPSSPWMWVSIISLATIPFFMMYAQKLQSRLILGEISKSLAKLKTMRENARKEAIDYIKTAIKISSTSSELETIEFARRSRNCVQVQATKRFQK